MVALCKAAGAVSLRWPGGCIAHRYNWKKTVGPLSKRPDQGFGLPEFLTFCEAAGAEPVLTLAVYWGGPADGADLVEYLNAPNAGRNPNGGVDWGDVRARNGHPKPYGIHYWEFGNEPYLVGQHYWWSGNAATRLQQFIEGGWQRQTAKDAAYQDNDGLFLGCDLATRRQGTGAPNQAYRVRFAPIALPGDDKGAAGVGDGPITEPVLRVYAESDSPDRVKRLLEAGQELVVVRKGRIRLRNDRIGLTADERDVLGSFTVETVDEVVSEGSVAKRSFFDLINAGDEIIPLEQPAEPPQAAEEGEPGLLRRVLSFVGL